MDFNDGPDPTIVAGITDPGLKQLYIDSMLRFARLNNFLNKYMSTAIVLISPYFAFFLWLFFRHGRHERNFAEMTVAYILFSGFIILACTIFVSPWLALTKNSSLYFFVNISLLTYSIRWACPETLAPK